jgi:uncharacterized phage protein (TIGR02218 family)
VKTIPTALATHYAGGELTLAYAIHITRASVGSPSFEVLGYTSHDVAQTVDGVACAAGGVCATTLTANAGMAVDNLELRTLDDGSLFTLENVTGGLWRDATFKLLRYNWASPTDGVEYLCAGVLGNVQFLNGQVVVELRGLQQFLQQSVGTVSTKTCRARLGDTLCAKNLTTFTHSGTVTSVTSKQQFAASALNQATDYYGEGLVTWLTGANAGLQQKVKTHTGTGGTFLLMLPMPYTITVGDTLRAVAGCHKRLEEDCGTKFNNVLNFQGEPHRPGVDALTANPEISV